jgi:hypothetical protein
MSLISTHAYNFTTDSPFVVTTMERKQTRARTKSEESLLEKQLATITEVMVRAAKGRDEEVKRWELRAQQGTLGPLI